MIELDDPSWWPTVTLDGVVWAVAPRQIPGVSIGGARQLAAQNGCELPSPELVRAIHAAADCQLAGGSLFNWPAPGSPESRRPRSWLDARMNAPEVHAETAARVAAAVEAWRSRHDGAEPRLVSGAYKDVVIDSRGALGIYGWPMSNGSMRQGFYARHSPAHADYSQALRLCKRVGTIASAA